MDPGEAFLRRYLPNLNITDLAAAVNVSVALAQVIIEMIGRKAFDIDKTVCDAGGPPLSWGSVYLAIGAAYSDGIGHVGATVFSISAVQYQITLHAVCGYLFRLHHQQILLHAANAVVPFFPPGNWPVDINTHAAALVNRFNEILATCPRDVQRNPRIHNSDATQIRTGLDQLMTKITGATVLGHPQAQAPPQSQPQRHVLPTALLNPAYAHLGPRAGPQAGPGVRAQHQPMAPPMPQQHRPQAQPQPQPQHPLQQHPAGGQGRRDPSPEAMETSDSDESDYYGEGFPLLVSSDEEYSEEEEEEEEEEEDDDDDDDDTEGGGAQGNINSPD